MASAATGAKAWYRGRVKAVPSGDCLVIVAMTSAKPGPLPEKTITLSSLIAPRLARRGGSDEPFAWESREFLRKLCIGKEAPEQTHGGIYGLHLRLRKGINTKTQSIPDPQPKARTSE